MSQKWIGPALLFCCFVVSTPMCQAAGEPPEAASEEAARPAKSDLALGMIAFASALTIGLCAMATAMAQSRIGSAGCGTIAERPETAGSIIVLLAIPETMVILGFVVAVLLIFGL